MKKNRIDFKEKRRYAIKKVSGKTASVFIGATIFGIILSSNLSIDNTKADTVSNTTATTISNNQTSETSNVVTLMTIWRKSPYFSEGMDSLSLGLVESYFLYALYFWSLTYLSTTSLLMLPREPR